MALQLLNIDARATVSLDSFARKWADPAKNPADAIDNLYAAQKWNADAALARGRRPTPTASSISRRRTSSSSSRQGDGRGGAEAGQGEDAAAASANDRLLPPEMSRQARDILKAQGNKVDYAEIEGALGHLNGIVFIARSSR